MAIKLSVDTQGIDRLVRETKDKHFSPNAAVRKYVPIAKARAPEAQDSRGGGTRDAIGGIYSGDDKFAILRLSQPRLRSPLRAYHLWMHGIGAHDISDYIKQNKGKFMFRVAEEMADYVNRTARQEYKFN